METASDLYTDAALCYTAMIRQVNQEAAAALDQIFTDFGPHAALRAALIVTILKMEVLGNHWIPDISLYDYLLDEFPAARPLARLAMNCCLKSWHVDVPEVRKVAVQAVS